MHTCINCGCEVEHLYKKYSSTVLKLTNCDNCNSINDKYIEYDPIIIVIDLILLNKKAYRHILYNTPYLNYWKILIVLLIMESYSEFMLIKLPFITNLDNEKAIILDNFYTGDLEFYLILFKVLCRNSIFLFVTYVLTKVYLKENDANLLMNLMKCFSLSSFGYLLFLPSLIWNKYVPYEYHLICVSLYTTLSQLIAYAVTSKCSKMWSIFVILLAYIFKFKLFDAIHQLLA